MELQAGNVLHGFTVDKVTALPDIQAVGYELTHTQSGARVFYVKAEDDNKVFTIGFRTPSQDDTGVAHITEHSVLCGSRKYRLKEPFVELVKGSLNTFLNAMTYPDKTVYPVASRNDKDFKNLVDVYLDAVFYPLIPENPYTLRQEGWHYELGEGKDKPLVYNGVVYNEMKGVYSSPDAIEEHETFKALFPDSPYRFESGGLPEAIPQLTQEGFVAFHTKYYSPENAYIYLYGNMNIASYLKYLDEAYLQHFHRTPGFKVEIPLQAPFERTKEVRATYPVAAGSTTDHKTYLSMNIVVGSALDQKRIMALKTLTHVLLDGNSAPLRLALLQAGIGSDVYGSLEGSLLQPVFSVHVSGADPEKEDQFVKVVYSTLQKLSREGIPEQLLTAALNAEEFKMREADYNVYPKGLIYGLGIMESWLYGGDPTTTLQFTDNLDFLRKAIGKRYYEQLIETVLLDNTHKVLLTLTPEPGKEEKDAAHARDAMAAIKATMDQKALDEVEQTAATLHARQAAPDTSEALRTIPLLERSDIAPKAEVEQPEIYKDGSHTKLYLPAFTNKIAYFDWSFDLTGLPEEQLCYAYLLTDVLGKVDTDDYTYQELSTLSDLYLGGLDFEVRAFSQYTDLNTYTNVFKVSAKVLEQNEEHLFDLLTSIALRSHLNDKKRLKEIISEVKTGWDNAFFARGMTVATSRLMSYFSASARSQEHDQFTYYQFLQDLDAHFTERADEVAAHLQALLPAFFHQDAQVMALSCSKDMEPAAEKAMDTFTAALPHSPYAGKAAPALQAPGHNEGITTSGKVQYVLAGGNYRAHGYAYTGAMKVLETILRYDYLWTRVRVKGGAYGAGARFDPNGVMYFSSYRDPNLAETLQVYRDLSDYLEHFTASEREMTKHVIGTISLMDTPLTASMHLQKAVTAYLTGRKPEEAQENRDAVLRCSQDDIKALAPLVRDVLQDGYLCVVGGEEKIKEHNTLFTTILKAQN